MNRKLHIGCGLNTPTDWVNLDGSWNAWLANYPLLRKMLGNLHVISNDKNKISWPKGIGHKLRLT